MLVIKVNLIETLIKVSCLVYKYNKLCLAQRSRRSSRSLDESQRRRGNRQIPRIIGAGLRPSGARPAIDLPPGYGN